MRTEQIKIFTITELSEDAQDYAYQKWLSHNEYPWHDENRGSLDKFEKIFPIKVKNWEYGYGCHISFTMICEDALAEISGIRLMKHIYTHYFSDIFSRKHYSIMGKNGKYKYRHSRIMWETENCPLTGYWIDNVLLDPIWEFLKKPDSRTFKDLMGDCLHKWVHTCEDDFEACQTKEYFLDLAQANDMEYTEDGRIY